MLQCFVRLSPVSLTCVL